MLESERQAVYRERKKERVITLTERVFITERLLMGHIGRAVSFINMVLYWGEYLAETTHQNRPMIWPKQLCGNDSNQGTTMWKEKETSSETRKLMTMKRAPVTDHITYLTHADFWKRLSSLLQAHSRSKTTSFYRKTAVHIHCCVLNIALSLPIRYLHFKITIDR